MASAAGLFVKGRSGLWGALSWLTDDFRVVIADLDDFAKAITGATNATPIVITSAAHGYNNGDEVVIINVGGNTNANGRFKVAGVATNTFQLTDPVTDANVAGNASYTSGGLAVNLKQLQYLSDIPSGSRIATSTTLQNKAVTADGYCDADDIQVTATGDQSEALIIYHHTGTESTSELVYIQTQGTGLPFNPSGSPVMIQWPSAGIFG